MTHSRRFDWLTIAALVLPPLFWAGNVIVARAARGDVPPFTLSFGRWVIALACLLPFAWPYLKRDWPLYRQHFRLIMAVALTGVLSFNTLVYSGLHYTTSTNALLLNSGIPVLIMLIGALFYQQKLRPLHILGLTISLAGVLTIILHGEWARLLSLSFNRGDLLVFAAVICWAFYTLLMRRIPVSINRTGLTALTIGIALVFLLPLWLWERSTGALPIWNARAVWSLAYVGLLPSVAAYLLYTQAVARVGAVRAGLSIHLMPVFGTLLAVGLLGESLHSYHLMGIAAIFIGIGLSNRQ